MTEMDKNKEEYAVIGYIEVDERPNTEIIYWAKDLEDAEDVAKMLNNPQKYKSVLINKDVNTDAFEEWGLYYKGVRVVKISYIRWF